MINTPLIGFTGPAGAGKSTAATILLKNHTRAMRMSFARPLKRMIYELIREALPKAYPHKASDLMDDPTLKNQPLVFLGGMTPRYLMQTLGTEWGRQAVNENFWVDLAAVKVERALGNTRHGNVDILPLKFVFDDVRFGNEAEMIRRYGGVIVRIERPDATQDPAISGHASEAFDFKPDMVILNDGTPEDLQDKLLSIWPKPEKKA